MNLFRSLLLALLLTVLSLSMLSCAERDPLVGTWKTHTSFLGVVTETSYEFRDDLTGIRKSGALDFGTSFSYKVTVSEPGITTESGEITIHTSLLGIKNTEHYHYERTGDSLRLTSDKGIVTEYRKE